MEIIIVPHISVRTEKLNQGFAFITPSEPLPLTQVFFLQHIVFELFLALLDRLSED